PRLSRAVVRRAPHLASRGPGPLPSWWADGRRDGKGAGVLAKAGGVCSRHVPVNVCRRPDPTGSTKKANGRDPGAFPLVTAVKAQVVAGAGFEPAKLSRRFYSCFQALREQPDKPQ